MRPLIQVDDLIREMNDEEYEIHLERIKDNEAKEQEKLKAQTQAELKRNTALTKLEALGLDEDDLRALGL